jgi:hypothetical protein
MTARLWCLVKPLSRNHKRANLRYLKVWTKVKLEKMKSFAKSAQLARLSRHQGFTIVLYVTAASQSMIIIALG